MLPLAEEIAARLGSERRGSVRRLRGCKLSGAHARKSLVFLASSCRCASCSAGEATVSFSRLRSTSCSLRGRCSRKSDSLSRVLSFVSAIDLAETPARGDSTLRMLAGAGHQPWDQSHAPREHGRRKARSAYITIGEDLLDAVSGEEANAASEFALHAATLITALKDDYVSGLEVSS